MYWRLSLVTCLLLTTFVFPPTTDARSSYSGVASHYSKGVMERVSRVRHLPVVNCMIASPYHTIGTWLTVKGIKTGKVRKCRVTDVPQPYDRPTILRRGIVAEIGYASTLALCGSLVDPPRRCPVRITPGG